MDTHTHDQDGVALFTVKRSEPRTYSAWVRALHMPTLWGKKRLLVNGISEDFSQLQHRLRNHAKAHNFISFYCYEKDNEKEYHVDPSRIQLVVYDQDKQEGVITLDNKTELRVGLPKREFCKVFNDQGYGFSKSGGLVCILPEEAYPFCVDRELEAMSPRKAPAPSIISGCGHAH